LLRENKAFSILLIRNTAGRVVASALPFLLFGAELTAAKKVQTGWFFSADLTIFIRYIGSDTG